MLPFVYWRSGEKTTCTYLLVHAQKISLGNIFETNKATHASGKGKWVAGKHAWKGTLCYTSISTFFFFLVSLHFIYFFIVIQLQLSAFSPHPSTPSQPIPPPSPTSTLPLDFVLVSFIVAPVNPSPHYSSPLPSGYC